MVPSPYQAPRYRVTAQDVKVFFAPEGVLWIEEGVYVAEERNNKNVSKNKYLQESTLEGTRWAVPRLGVEHHFWEE